jgi:hypothetical protein
MKYLNYNMLFAILTIIIIIIVIISILCCKKSDSSVSFCGVDELYKNWNGSTKENW